MSLINIVLFQPEIPQNTGNIARMCVSNDLVLHLIKPLGFELTDKYLKRAGLDYWQDLEYKVYESWEEFLATVIPNEVRNPMQNQKGEDWSTGSLPFDFAQGRDDKPKIWLLTTKAEKSFWEVKFKEGDYLVFGPETRGLPEELIKEHYDHSIKVPMRSDKSRSLNLASTAQTVFYEAFRQLN